MAKKCFATPLMTSLSTTKCAWTSKITGAGAVADVANALHEVAAQFNCYTLGPILLACVSNVLIFCHIWLVWTNYVYHRFTWHPYWTFPLSQYLAALDPLTRLSSPFYLSSHSHDHNCHRCGDTSLRTRCWCCLQAGMERKCDISELLQPSSGSNEGIETLRFASLGRGDST